MPHGLPNKIVISESREHKDLDLRVHLVDDPHRLAVPVSAGNLHVASSRLEDVLQTLYEQLLIVYQKHPGDEEVSKERNIAIRDGVREAGGRPAQNEAMTLASRRRSTS
jgi:hypothetical protein